MVPFCVQKEASVWISGVISEYFDTGILKPSFLSGPKRAAAFVTIHHTIYYSRKQKYFDVESMNFL